MGMTGSNGKTDSVTRLPLQSRNQDKTNTESADNTSGAPEDRRRYRRRDVDTPASVICQNCRAIVTICDISATGAKLQVGGTPQDFAGEIDLVIPHRGHFSVRKIWQENAFLGVHFLDRTLTEPHPSADKDANTSTVQAAA